ncbi:NAD(P)/FAD-dependent oxidoreductase [Ralstonia sp. 25mfcol4.1]|uniref:protoporphyrinogen/coproporphyrinogen oxidase n=1 Tax=Ralstonia sp. 25mfcol4.1 TaxID=1761899 RepID=UPI0015878E67|nr:NAD(P)/FAD-dependent oxidoreductase [Ralstonia sp. 25mfcol4.1]
MKQTTIVIGAGIAGLAAAHTLKAAGQDVIVVEGSSRPGGRLVRMQRGNDSAEAGGQGIHSNYRELIRLAGAYGLEGDLIPQTNHQPAYLDRAGNLRYPQGRTGITKLMNARGKRDFAWFAAKYMTFGKKFDLFETALDLPGYDNLSAAEAFSWAGEDFRDFILRPSAHAMANTTPEHTNLYHYMNLMRLVATTSVMTLRTGNVTLPEKIAAAVGVRYECPAEKISFSGRKVDGVVLASGESIKADHVIVATPVGYAAKLMPDHLANARTFLGGFPNAPFGLVYFFLDRPLMTDAYVYLGHAYRDTVFNMAINHSVKTPHMVPSGKGILSAWPCYPNSADFDQLTNTELINLALKDIDAFFPGVAEYVEEARVQRHPWGVGRLSVGQHAKILKFKKDAESFSGISFAGNDYDGVHMESAVRSGMRAANRVLAGIS